MREVVLDIETIPCRRHVWRDLGEPLQRKFLRDARSDADAWKNTALDPALGRIVCIGLGFAHGGKLRFHSAAGADEAALLRRFWAAIHTEDYIIGHNVSGFDLPFVRARSVVHQVQPSRQFDLRRYTTDNIYDTMEVWAHWQWGKAPSLALLSAALGFGEKAGSGRDVYKWYCEKKWDQIERYCQKDLKLTYQIYRRMKKHGL